MTVSKHNYGVTWLDHTVSLLRSAVSCALKVSMIAWRVWRPFEIFTPLVARAVICIIF
jgi:hypothetical protein